MPKAYVKISMFGHNLVLTPEAQRDLVSYFKLNYGIVPEKMEYTGVFEFKVNNEKTIKVNIDVMELISKNFVFEKEYLKSLRMDGYDPSNPNTTAPGDEDSASDITIQQRLEELYDELNEVHNEMDEISHKISQISGEPGNAGELLMLEKQYSELMERASEIQEEIDYLLSLLGESNI
jgi:tetrahydromethanopterin S-methyltransferase subunit G